MSRDRDEYAWILRIFRVLWKHYDARGIQISKNATVLKAIEDLFRSQLFLLGSRLNAIHRKHKARRLNIVYISAAVNADQKTNNRPLFTWFDRFRSDTKNQNYNQFLAQFKSQLNIPEAYVRRVLLKRKSAYITQIPTYETQCFKVLVLDSMTHMVKRWIKHAKQNGKYRRITYASVVEFTRAYETV